MSHTRLLSWISMHRADWRVPVAILAASLFAFSFLFFLPAERASAIVQVASDDFELDEQGTSGFGWLDDWSFSNDAGYTPSGQPHGGSRHLRLRKDGSFAVREADTGGETALRLKFWARIDDLDDNEAFIEVSDNGSTYVEVQSWDEDNDGDPYTFFDIDLSPLGLTLLGQLWVRVRISGESANDGVLFVDDIELVDTASEPDPPPDPGVSPITIDGEFGDWDGKANLSDPFDDQVGNTLRDIATLYWANNIDEGVNFHMIERHTRDGLPFDGTNGQFLLGRFVLFVDTNNNGDYDDSADRRITVSHIPLPDTSLVNVRVYSATSPVKLSDSGWNDWGDSLAEGGLRVEFPVDWDDLGIQFGGVIRMYASSFFGSIQNPTIRDRVPDGTADIQWSPASVFGPWVLGGVSVLGIGVIWFLSRRRRLWT